MKTDYKVRAYRADDRATKFKKKKKLLAGKPHMNH